MGKKSKRKEVTSFTTLDPNSSTKIASALTNEDDEEIVFKVIFLKVSLTFMEEFYCSKLAWSKRRIAL